MNQRLPRYDVVIVGGGVIGLTAALELRRRLGTEGRIAVLDRQQPGREASWAGAGIIPPGEPHSPALHELARRSHELWPHLSAELRDWTGLDNGYFTCGSIELCASAAEAEQEASNWRRSGVPAWAVPDRIANPFVSSVRFAPETAYFLPTTAQVRNPWHLRALRVAVERTDDVIADAGVTGIVRSGGRVTSIQTAQGDFHAGRFLIAAGAWTQELLRSLDRELPAPEIEPMRGQIVLLQVPTTQGWCIVEAGKRYLVPRRDGRVLVGSTEELSGFQKENTPEAVAGLMRFARETVPVLEDARVEQTWAGLRPYAKRGRPCIGPVPGLDNLFVAAGHFRAGLSQSPATARLVADQMLGQSPSLPEEVVQAFVF